MLWAELRQRPATLPVLLACAVVVALHQVTHAHWFIDDAAICFAYARNLVAGEGLVPWPGGERVEAVSDPTWVLLLAGFQAAGLSGFVVAKPLGLLLAVASLVPTWRIARAALPDHDGDGALVAPVVLALDPQLAIWCASGLENGLFVFLLAVLIDRTLRETAQPGPHLPGAAVAGLLLAFTRPEGIAYAAMAGGWLLVFGWLGGQGLRPALRYAAVVLVPGALLELARLWYFAWPLPNPYYAKIASRGVTPLQWDGRGWWQLREWAARLWHVYYAPLYAIGLTGTSRRAWIGLAAVGLLGLALLATSPAVVLPRLVAIALALVLLPLLGLGRPGGRATVVCGHAVAIGLLFVVWANGDWMGGYRFVSLVAAPRAVILGVGITRAVDALQRRVRGRERRGDVTAAAVSVAVGALVAPDLSQMRDHLRFNHDETTASVKQRVDHTREVLRTTFWTEPVTTLEVDQGAHLWWAPDYRSLDMGMLVDVPMGRHWYQQRAFVQEYVYAEHRPTFAHVTGWWALHSGLRTYPPFERGDYVELPPYTDLRDGRPYRGVFVHRELIVAPPGSTARPRAARWVPGQDGYLELPLATTAATLRVIVRDGAVDRARFELPVGYRLLDPADARPGEIFRNRFAVAAPADLEPGLLQVVVEGHPVDLTVQVGTAAERDREIARLRAELAELTASERCEEAVDRAIWIERQRPTDWAWHAQRPGRADDRGQLAGCWARRAAGLDGAAQIDALARAHRWDHHSPALREVGGPVAARLLDEGAAARRAGDWPTAYARYAAVLRFQPWRSWARRHAEEARDHRLGLTDDVRVGFGGADEGDGADRR